MEISCNICKNGLIWQCQVIMLLHFPWIFCLLFITYRFIYFFEFFATEPKHLQLRRLSHGGNSGVNYTIGNMLISSPRERLLWVNIPCVFMYRLCIGDHDRFDISVIFGHCFFYERCVKYVHDIYDITCHGEKPSITVSAYFVFMY